MYASTTTVPIERSKSELKSVIYKYGASNYQFAESDEKAMVVFAVDNRMIKFVLIFPPLTAFARSHGGRRARTKLQMREAHGQECKRRWRSLILSIKAKFESAESEIETFEEAFLAQILLPDKTTVSENIIPMIEEAYAKKRMPKFKMLE